MPETITEAKGPAYPKKEKVYWKNPRKPVKSAAEYRLNDNRCRTS